MAAKRTRRAYGANEIILCTHCKTAKAVDLSLELCLVCKEQLRKRKRRVPIPIERRRCSACGGQIRMREVGPMRDKCRKCEPVTDIKRKRRSKLADLVALKRRMILGNA